MASDDTTLLLDAANMAALRLMLDRATDGDVLEVFKTACGQGAIGDLAAEQMKRRNLDF